MGAIAPLSGRLLQLAQADATTATATNRITIRYRPDLTIYQRFVYAPEGTDEYGALVYPRYYRIDAIDDTDERHRELVCTVTEVRA